MIPAWLTLISRFFCFFLFNRIQYLFKPRPGENHPNHSFYRKLFPKIVNDIDSIDNNWRMGHHNLQRINCRSENSKGVYCLQYDDEKIVSGLRDNTIKIWDRHTLQCTKVLTGHTGSVLCLQYDDKAIISGSSDSTVRVWDANSFKMVNTLIHHCEAVLHLRFHNGMMVTCSKVCYFPTNYLPRGWPRDERNNFRLSSPSNAKEDYLGNIKKKNTKFSNVHESLKIAATIVLFLLLESSRIQ